jgi:hypothetical protein
MYINTDWIKSEIGVLQILTGVAVFFVYPNPAGKGSHWTQLEIPQDSFKILSPQHMVCLIKKKNRKNTF